MVDVELKDLDSELVKPDRETVSLPWETNPYRLISWWEMEQFSARAFYQIGRLLGRLREGYSNPVPTSEESILFPAQRAEAALDRQLSAEDRSGYCEFMSAVEKQCNAIGLKMSVIATSRAKSKAESPDFGFTNRDADKELEKVDERIRDEMAGHLFMHVPQGQADYYDQKELFGLQVNTKFPGIQFDMVEAGNSYAAGRATACVFHLMRIMEVGVQEFGNKLGVPLANEKNWQNILDEINKAIRVLPKSLHTVEMSQVSANLYAVKVAWRNEVMHPKDTYTLEEAENLIRQVKIFMGQLAAIV